MKKKLIKKAHKVGIFFYGLILLIAAITVTIYFLNTIPIVARGLSILGTAMLSTLTSFMLNGSYAQIIFIIWLSIIILLFFLLLLLKNASTLKKFIIRYILTIIITRGFLLSVNWLLLYKNSPCLFIIITVIILGFFLKSLVWVVNLYFKFRNSNNIF